MRRNISVVITDLDNTLFDWVDIWYRSFRAMLNSLVKESGVSEEILIRDFKQIHEKHGTSEYAFSIQELPCLQEKYPGEDLPKRFENAKQAWRDARKSALRLYPTVVETLETLKDRGTLLVGYTESMAFYTNYRVRTLGLDRILDYLFSPPDHDVPPDFQRQRPDELKRTVHRDLAKGTTKPNPKVLQDIIREVGASPGDVVYVGDTLMKDILMALTQGFVESGRSTEQLIIARSTNYCARSPIGRRVTWSERRNFEQKMLSRRLCWRRSSQNS